MISLPGDDQRHAIVGATGSGKTQAALHHLSLRNFHQMPWIIYDFKRDHNIGAIDGAVELPTNEIPDAPGIYVTHPFPDDEESVSNQMRAVWERGDTGVYVDEGYMVGRQNKWFRALLTQGRSKRIPMIVLSQRPVWMDRFVFSESEYFQIFRLQHRKDRRTVEEFVPVNLENRLQEFWSYYYDVKANRPAVLSPVPHIDVIQSTFARRLRPRHRRAV